MKKDKTLSLKISTKDYDRIHKNASQNGVSVSEYIRSSKNPNSYTKKEDIRTVISYVLQDNKRTDDDVWNCFRIFDKSKNGIIEDFYRLKQLYDKTDGLQLKHLILSWGTRPDIPRKKLRKIIKQTMGFWGKDYQLVYAIHEDRQPNKWHAHIVINSVSNTGRKIQITRSTLTKFKRKFNNIWNPYGYELHMEEHNHIQNRGLGTHKNNIFLWVWFRCC